MAFFNIPMPLSGYYINSYAAFWNAVVIPDGDDTYNDVRGLVHAVLNGENEDSLIENASIETQVILSSMMCEFDRIVERINNDLRMQYITDKSTFKPTSRIRKHDELFTTLRCNKNNSLKGENCTICLDGFKPNQIFRKTCAKCVFHALCIDTWIINSNDKSCPNCKRTFTIK